MPDTSHFEGLIAAAHAPLLDDGRLHLEAIPRQAEALLAAGVRAAFVCGSTGEGHSLTVAERRSITRCWVEATRGTSLRVIAHVGHLCQQDATTLAAAAQVDGADALAALPPSYFKPESVAELIRFLAPIAGAAGDLPFFYYDIPGMTGVSLSAVELLEKGERALPSLAGIKYTNPDMIQLQECLHAANGRFEILFGIDECLLAGLVFGAKGAVGSSYNFAAPISRRIIAAFQKQELDSARAEQLKSVRLIRLLASFGYLPASKHVMGLLGVPVGPVRSPLRRLTDVEKLSLERQLKDSDLWDAIQIR